MACIVVPRRSAGDGLSIPATGFIVALAVWAVSWRGFCGLSSDLRAERVRHVAIPFLVAACGFCVASLAPSNVVVLAALMVVVVSIDTGMGVFWTLPSTFLSAGAAAGGIALIRTISALGGFAGPTSSAYCVKPAATILQRWPGLPRYWCCPASLVLALSRVMAVRKVQLS